MNIYAVIMAGGGGTRFWPLSRQSVPKQILNLSGNDVMINETIARNNPVIPVENIYVVANKSQYDGLRKVLSDGIPAENILLEPVGRNTAACIGYAAVIINKRCGESIVCVFPSDAYISDTAKYADVLKLACECAENTDMIVTIGIKPTHPSTGYGYIKYGQPEFKKGIYYVEEFIEKPSLDNARKYLSEGKYLWNSGIFVWRTSVILRNFERFLPKLFKQLKSIEQYAGTDEQNSVVESLYPKLQSISVDYGILERSDEVLVIPGDFGWSDVGSWDALGAMFPPDGSGNIVKADHIGIDTKNSIVFGSKLIATIGLNAMVVVSTEDAVLICPKDRAQEVKNIVDIIKAKGKNEYI